MTSGQAIVFRCPSCGERIEVNAPMRDALIDSGCVVCGVAISDEAFAEE